MPIGATFPAAPANGSAMLRREPRASPAPLVVERAMYDSPGGVTWRGAAAAAADAVRSLP